MSEWKHTGSYPRRMHEEIKAKETAEKKAAPKPAVLKCSRCGGKHSTRDCDKERRSKVVVKAPVKEKPIAPPREPAIQAVHGIVLHASKPVLTNKARRYAKRRFPQHMHVPWGMRMLFHSWTDQESRLVGNVEKDFARLDGMAFSLFHAKFDVLRRKNQLKVIDAVISQKHDESVVKSVMKG